LKSFSLIIPVFNRPKEIEELLKSIVYQTYKDSFEIVIIEDGSKKTSKDVISKFKNKLNITYLFKSNSGPGDSRNYGMHRAKGDFFIILDSDVILPDNYLKIVSNHIQNKELDAFGGVDTDYKTFTDIQKAINYAMTSFITTGGLRSKSNNNSFQLRSFNMGISKEVFEKTKGFAKLRFGEDIDLSIRIKKLGFKTELIPSAKVYHKRRVNFEQFFRQTFNFGRARPVLSKMHKNTSKITYWFPTFFSFGLLFSLVLLLLGQPIFVCFYFAYFFIIFIDSYIKTKSFRVAIISIYATLVQFVGYGVGFFRSWVRLHLQHKSIKETFQQMFS
jgi:cellulose synthase/poly-beta-1,6-N-acetylglucosamine synthase-like glycosyltransferase